MLKSLRETKMLADVFSYSATISVTGAGRWQSVPCPTSSDVLPGCFGVQPGGKNKTE